jgi:hypothetical protein
LHMGFPLPAILPNIPYFVIYIKLPTSSLHIWSLSVYPATGQRNFTCCGCLFSMIHPGLCVLNAIHSLSLLLSLTQ